MNNFRKLADVARKERQDVPTEEQEEKRRNGQTTRITVEAADNGKVRCVFGRYIVHEARAYWREMQLDMSPTYAHRLALDIISASAAALHQEASKTPENPGLVPPEAG